jgi:hypothetical protein
MLQMNRPEEGVASVAWSPDGAQVALAGAGGRERSESVRIWDPKTPKETRILASPSGYVTAVAFSTDSRWVASAGRDNVLEAEPDLRQHQLQVVHHAAGLRLDADRKRFVLVVRVLRYLSGDENPSVGFNRVAERRHWGRSPIEHVVNDRTHKRVSPCRSGCQCRSGIGIETNIPPLKFA